MHAEPFAPSWNAALRSGYFASIEKWLRDDPSALDSPQALGLEGTTVSERPLVWAAKSKQWSLAKKLVSLGANPNVLSADGSQTALEALVSTCLATQQHWPVAALEVVEAWLQHGCDPHVTALPTSEPVIGVCLAPYEEPLKNKAKAIRKKVQAADPVRRDMALRIWEQTQEREWSAHAQWAAWRRVLVNRRPAWVERLRMLQLSPVTWDRHLPTGMVALLGREVADPARRAEVFQALVGLGLEWRADPMEPGDDPLRVEFAQVLGRRLEANLEEASENVGRRGRL